MKKPKSSTEVGQLWCDALGLDASRVTELTLNLRPGKPAEIHARMLIDDPTSGNLATVVRQFQLVEKVDP